MKIFGSIFLATLIIDLFYVLWDIVRIFRGGDGGFGSTGER